MRFDQASALALLLSAAILATGACRGPRSAESEAGHGHTSEGAGSAAEDELLVPFDPERGAGLHPEIVAPDGSFDYALVYRLQDDRSGVATRFLGPSGAASVGLSMSEVERDGAFELVARVARSEHRFVLARWWRGADGTVERALVRTEPLIEIRVRPGLPIQQPPPEYEWRPWRDGRGVGPWRPDHPPRR